MGIYHGILGGKQARWSRPTGALTGYYSEAAMGRGLFSGVLWGSLLAVLSLWLLSQIMGLVGLVSEPPKDVAVLAPNVTTPAAVSNSAETPIAPDTQSSPATDPSRQGTGLNAANTDTSPTADTASAQVPDASNVVAGQPSPELDNTPNLESKGETASVAGMAAQAPVVPKQEDLPLAVVQSPNPQVETVGAVTPDAPVVLNDNTEIGDSETENPVLAEQPEQPESPVADTVPENNFSTPTVVATPDPVDVVPDTPSDESVVAQGDETISEPTATGTATVVDRSNSSAADETGAELDDGIASDGGETSADVVLDGRPAIERYAVAFENPEGRPLMAIVLLPSENSASLDPALPFPVSYVVDASKDDANANMLAIRAAGNEVAVLTPLPEGAAPKDVEFAFQTYMSAVPEAVAVFDVPNAVFQSGRDVATQVAEALAASGHGMVTYSRGLNSATQVAERAGVPAALVFRVFDDNNRDGAAIKRFLDQAAFRAGQQTGVVLVGHNRPETTAALLEWALGNRASTVAMAPLSVVLLDQ